MNRTNRRGIALAVVLVGLISWATLALPSFSDRNIDAGNLNPTDTIMVMEIRVTRGAGEDVTLASITIRNTGTAEDGDIEKIIVEDDGDVLGETDNLAGITSSNGVTIPLSYHLDNTTHTVKIFIVVGTNVEGGETVDLQALVDYTSGGAPGTSTWISDLTGETIRNGGFDELDDSSPDAAYLNPTDEAIVQTSIFTDNDANGSDVQWAGDGVTTIVEVENLGTALPEDIADIRVTLTIGGDDYVAIGNDWAAWTPASPMPFRYEDFWGPGGAADNPPVIPDNSGVTVTVEMRVEDETSVTDKRTIRTETTLHVQEMGEGPDGALVAYEQSIASDTTQTIRKQGFEVVEDDSDSLDSGTAATGDVVIQTVRAFDDDSNLKDLRLIRFWLQNRGSADGDEIAQVQLKAGAQTLLTLTGAELDNFRTGRSHELDIEIAPGDKGFDIEDNEEQVFKIYYTIGVPDDGHTLEPSVRFVVEEQPDGPVFVSDFVNYPDEIGLYEPGFEFIENMTPPNGGAAYSGQKLLAQKIRLEDRDEDDDDVTIDPVVVRNEGTASGNPDVVKIEIWRQDEEDGTEVKIGESSDLNGFRTGGVHVDIESNSIVQDSADGAEVFLLIYLQIADPEDMVATRTIQLETRVIHTEDGETFDKTAEGNQWVLETNNRPVVDFTFEKATNGAASVGPKADFTHEDTIQFNGTATDPDAGDTIDRWWWNFGDGATSTEQNPTHAYPNGGTFNVTLTAWDSRDVSGSVTKSIEVEGPPNEEPTIDELTADPENPAVDQDVVFAVTVTDPDQPGGTAFGYEWDFGDETTSTVAGPTHSYDEAGTYTVTVTVTDAQGATDTATIDISVGNEPPALTGVTPNPTTGVSTGDEVTLTVAGYTDPDDDAVDHYEWNFGDGTTAETDDATATHTFAAPGTYTVSVVAVDARGAESVAVTVDVTVTGPARTILFGYPNPAETQATFTYILPDGATDPILRIYSLMGRLIFEQALAAGGTTYVWDLRTGDGEALPNGLYFCVVTVTGADRSEVFRLLIVR